MLRSFTAVVRLGSISAAALHVGRTQSAISTQMKRLEEIVGGNVFHRSGSGMSLTRLGEKLLIHASSILAAHDAAIADLTDNGLQGVVSFGCPEDYLDVFVPTILGRFTEEHPAVEIEIASAPTSELKSMLHRQQIDVALISEPLEHGGPTPLRLARLVWIANGQNPAAFKGEAVSLALSAKDTLDHQTACQAMRRAGIPYRIAFAASSLTGLLAIARSGHAISVITDLAIPSDLIEIKDLLPTLPEIGIHLERSTETDSALLQEFCRIASEVVVQSSRRTEY